MSSSSDEDVSSPPYDESDLSEMEAVDEEIEDEHEEDPEDDENLPSDDTKYNGDDGDEDLDLDADEDDSPKPRRGAATRAPARPRAPVKKRTLTLYNEEEESTDGTETPPPARAKRQRVNNLDEDLILTDEEAEYDPHNNPDVSKMTERQRRRFLDEENGNSGSELFLELEDLDKKNTKRKQETEQETVLRKAENARRRQHLKNKQLEEEKQDTVNKLLKRRATKTRSSDTKEDHEEVVSLRPRRPTISHAAMDRWVSRKDGQVLGIGV